MRHTLGILLLMGAHVFTIFAQEYKELVSKSQDESYKTEYYEEKEETEEREACKCPPIRRPICGSDDVTYTNICTYKCAADLNPSLKAKFLGICGKEDQVRLWINHHPPLRTKRIIISASLLLAAEEPDPSIFYCTTLTDLHKTCGCTLSQESFYDPICGSDGLTYFNECYLQCRKYSDKPDITVKYSGFCKKEFKCKCNGIFDPVCGSDGVTYANECSLLCAEDKDSRVSLQHVGACASSGDHEYMYDTVRLMDYLHNLDFHTGFHKIL